MAGLLACALPSSRSTPCASPPPPPPPPPPRDCTPQAALRTHPDKASEEEREAAEVEFKAVQEAWGVLSDPAQRQRYNAGWDLAEINQVGGCRPCCCVRGAIRCVRGTRPGPA